MALIKKSEPYVFKSYGKEEFIYAYKIYSMNFDEESKCLSPEENRKRIAHASYDYGNKFSISWEEIIEEVKKWSEHLFRGEDRVSYELLYLRYIECLDKVTREPCKIRQYNDYGFLGYQWVFQSFVYEIKKNSYSDEQIKLLILDSFDKERVYFEKLKLKFYGAEEHEISTSRERIPENVRIEVWRRDGGKCARCGSREKLEYDHIVPVSRGGSNTVRNIELLCEKCNRSKSNNPV